MLKIFLTLAIGILMVVNAEAVCILKRGQPAVLNIPAQSIMINADAPNDTSSPIITYQSEKLGHVIGYDECDDGMIYGAGPIGLSNPSNGGLYPTNIPGISVKIIFNNTRMDSVIPFRRTMNFSGGALEGTMDFNIGSYYKIELYKTSNKLGLSSSPEGTNIALPLGLLSYYYLVTDSPDSSDLKLSIGDIKIYSTPSCTIDKKKNVDFGLVTSSKLTSSGIEKNLDFKLTCKTDYGYYSATASINATAASPDYKYITVKDATGKSDTLGIRITDSEDNLMLVNGTSSEIINNINSDSPAQFNWKATLMPINGAARPQNGKFSAQAEITLQVK